MDIWSVEEYLDFVQSYDLMKELVPLNPEEYYGDSFISWGHYLSKKNIRTERIKTSEHNGQYSDILSHSNSFYKNTSWQDWRNSYRKNLAKRRAQKAGIKVSKYPEQYSDILSRSDFLYKEKR